MGAEAGMFLAEHSRIQVGPTQGQPRRHNQQISSSRLGPLKRTGPVFSAGVELWVALINPVPRVQHESAVHKSRIGSGRKQVSIPGPRISPVGETGVESTGFVRIPRKSWLYIDRGNIQTCFFSCRGIVRVSRSAATIDRTTIWLQRRCSATACGAEAR
jgi:hypothetical protein